MLRGQRRRDWIRSRLAGMVGDPGYPEATLLEVHHRSLVELEGYAACVLNDERPVLTEQAAS